MFFEYPGILWLELLLIPLLLHYLYMELRGRNPHLRVSSVIPWKGHGGYVAKIARHIF